MHRLLIAILILLTLNLLHAAIVTATDTRVHTRAYWLDTGHQVRTWLDEGIGVWCATIFSTANQPAGITCAALKDTAYNWVIP